MQVEQAAKKTFSGNLFQKKTSRINLERWSWSIFRICVHLDEAHDNGYLETMVWKIFFAFQTNLQQNLIEDLFSFSKQPEIKNK